MMFNRVDYQRLLLEARPKAIAAYGAESVEKLESHFRDQIPALGAIPQQQLPYILLLLAGTDSVGNLVETLQEQIGIEHIYAERQILQALNAAPEDWKDEQQSFLFARGFVRGLEFFHKGRKEELENRPSIDKVMEALPEDSKKIVLAAVDASHLHKNKYGVTMKDRSLLYIAIQLVPDANKRVVLFAMMRKAHESSAYALALDSSANAITKLSAALAIPMESLPEPVMTLRAEAARAAARLPSPSDDMTYAAAGISTRAVSQDSKLEDVLDELIGLGEMTKFQKRIYLYATKPRHDGNLPTEEHIVSYGITQVGPRGSQETYLSRYDLRKWMPEIVQKVAKIYDNPPDNSLVPKP